MIEGSSGLRIFTSFFFKLRWWQIGGGGKLLCIITMVLWHVRVSSRLLGLSDDETAPLGPPVPFLWDSLKALLLHTIWGGAGNCFYVSPLLPLSCEFLIHRTQHREHLFVAEEKEILGVLKPCNGGSLFKLFLQTTRKARKVYGSKANVARKPFIRGD